MIKQIGIASGNVGKIREMSAILRDFFPESDFLVCSVKDILGSMPDVVEDGDTFIENAVKKIIDLPLREGVMYVSDDSGLCVDALDGRPGIFSARYGGPGVTSEDQCRLLLRELDGQANRKAHYTCALAFRFPDGQIETVEGYWHGQIGMELKGAFGFGYDPLFIPDGLSVTSAELKSDVKNKMSHRMDAFQKAKVLATLSALMSGRGAAW